MLTRIGWARAWTVAIALFSFGILIAIPAARSQEGSMYKVDPFWPKRLPNKWSMQQIVDIYVDREDHVWVINRASDARPDELGAATTPPRTECCVVGPEIVEFDTDGSVLRAWGGKDYVPGWPGRLQTIGVDRDENVWISGTMPGDSILKFSKEGKLLWDFGHRGPKVAPSEVKQNNQQTDIFPPGIAAFEFDEDAREIYIPDGFLNKRVLVYDMDTGAFKRGWGGKGTPLREIDNDPTPPYDASGPPPDQKMFAPALHCAHPSTESRGPHCGSIWSMTDPPCGTIYNLTLSTDPGQKHILVADGTDNMVWILNREDGALVGSFGGNGRYAGQLHWIDSIAMDSKGNVYTGEVED